MRASLKIGFSAGVLAVLLGGCQNWWPQQGPKPSQGVAEIARCRQGQAALIVEIAAFKRQQAALAALTAERFIPPAKPTPIDPALAERYTQEDRELDEQRYQRSLLDWEQLHSERYRLWLADHTGGQRQLELGLQAQAKRLRQLNRSVFNKVGALGLNAEAVAKYSGCEPQNF